MNHNSRLYVGYEKTNNKMAKNEQTSPKMAAKAAKALSNPNSSKLTRSLAGALLTQSPDKKKK
jgi:hypothetical protein